MCLCRGLTSKWEPSTGSPLPFRNLLNSYFKQGHNSPSVQTIEKTFFMSSFCQDIKLISIPKSNESFLWNLFMWYISVISDKYADSQEMLDYLNTNKSQDAIKNKSNQLRYKMFWCSQRESEVQNVLLFAQLPHCVSFCYVYRMLSTSQREAEIVITVK